jgi:hypothetical protein
MNYSRSALLLLLVAGLGSMPLFAAPQANEAPASIRRVAVLGGTGSLELEIDANARINPQTQLIANPDRLVIDFPNAVPGNSLHDLAVNRGAVKGVRVGLFSANPPVTRVVVDLRKPQDFQLFPSGNNIIVKLPVPDSQVAAVHRPQLAAFTTQFEVVTDTEPEPAPAAAPAQPAPRFRVDYQGGKLSIWADKATLAEVLYEVQRKTGADIAIPSGAEQESVFANLGPGLPRDVLTSLLNGTNYNVVLVGSATNPDELRSVILTVKGDASADVPANNATLPPPVPVPQENPISQ